MAEDKPLLDPYRKTIVEIVVKQVMGVLLGRVPWLSFGPFNAVIVYFLTKVFYIALDKTILGLNLYLIEVRTDGNVNELRGLLDGVATATPEEREVLEDKIIDSSRNLIKLYDDRRMRLDSTK